MKNKYIALILALPLAIFLAAAAPRAAEAETAVVDVARVIDASAPGKAGQQYVDNLQKALNEEFERFRKANEKEKRRRAENRAKTGGAERRILPRTRPRDGARNGGNCAKSWTSG